MKVKYIEMNKGRKGGRERGREGGREGERKEGRKLQANHVLKKANMWLDPKLPTMKLTVLICN